MRVQAFILCDAATRDSASGKWHITGIFDRIRSAEFPAVHAQMALYLRLAFDGPQPETSLEIVGQNPAGNRTGRIRLALEATQQPTFDIGLTITGFTMSEPGDYFFLLLHGENELTQYRLSATKAEDSDD